MLRERARKEQTQAEDRQREIQGVLERMLAGQERAASTEVFVMLRVNGFWYRTPSEGTPGPFVLSLQIAALGVVQVGFHLTGSQMVAAVANLGDKEYRGRAGGGEGNAMWWGHEWVVPEDGDEDEPREPWFGSWGKEVPVVLYRDDDFMVALPHAVGLRILEVLEDALSQINDGTARRTTLVGPPT
jgi:hypothetical protein